MHRILVIDDEASIRNSLVCHFEDSGYDVFSAESAEEALEIIAIAEINAAIVDLRLPGKTGDDFIQEVYHRSEKTVFIIYTGSTDYTIPSELQKLPRVSETLFHKPINDLTILNKEIEKLLSCKSK